MVQTGLLLTNDVLNALSAQIAVLDASGLIVLVNDAWRRFARENGGVSGAESSIGTNYLAVCREAVDRDDPTARAALLGIEEVLRGDRAEFLLEYPCATPDRERWFRMSATRFATGPERHVVVAHEEITAQKLHDRALEESEQLLRSVLDALPIGVWILNADGRIVQGNAAGRRIWGGARFVGPEGLGEYTGWWLSTGKRIAPDEWAAARAVRNGETSIDEEIEIECFDTTHKIILNSAVPLYDADGRLTGAILVNQDITARKHAEAEREAILAEHDRLRLAAQEANGMKDDFIATLSHELRTPLQSVLGWAVMLKQARPDAASPARAAAAIERNARVLAQLLDDTLDFSRVVRGKLTLNTTAVDLTAIVGDVIESMRPSALEKGVSLVEHVRGGGATVLADPTRLQQIVWNLLTNALKFTPRGGTIEVDVHTGDEWVDVSVRDSGVGIAPEFLPFVFDRFRQREGAPAGARTGLGLGLAIVKELVELHRGTISAHSAGEGHGATFMCRLPFHRKPDDRVADAAVPDAEPPDA